MRSYRLFLAALLAIPAAGHAQGTLSTQGFGYPGGGQASTRSLGAGAAMAESDPLSATNPAAILSFGGSVLYFQAEPEYRTSTRGGASESATIARYPLVTAAVPLGSRFFGALTVSNLLDRSFLTTVRGSQVLSGETIGSTNTFSSNGAIGDVRLALAWAPMRWLRVGAGGHVITGDNKLNSTQVFDDSSRFAALIDTQTVTYSGTAFSGGVDINVGSVGTLSASYRHGGPLSVKRADTTLRKANAPDRMAFGAAYTGIRGTTIGVRAAKDKWTNMAPLFLVPQRISDAWDTSIGADVLGPRLFGSLLQLRAGARSRTLPFGTPGVSSTTPATATGADVKETSFSLGTGAALARGRASLDVAGIRATRTASGSALQEKSWTLSVGVAVRP